MNELAVLRDRIGSASGLAAVLDAAWSGLSVIESACWECQSSTQELFAAFIFANVAATEARMALAEAPSLPRVSADPPGQAAFTPEGDVAGVADAVASLAEVLADRLADAGRRASNLEDRTACERAAAGTRRIAGLLERGEQ